MATAPAVGANLKRQLEQIGEEIADLQTSAANHRKELEGIETKRLTCHPDEIAKLVHRRDVVQTLLDRVTNTLAEREAAHGATSRELRAEEKAYEDGAPFRKIGQLTQEIETDLAPMRNALNPGAWTRIQRNLYELRGMGVLNIQTVSRVVTMDGPRWGTNHADRARAAGRGSSFKNSFRTCAAVPCFGRNVGPILKGSAADGNPDRHHHRHRHSEQLESILPASKLVLF